MPEDDFEGFQVYLSNLKDNVDNLIQSQIEQKSEASIDTLARATLREILLELGMAAIDAISEYDNAELKVLFSDMLQRSSHISIQKGQVITAFNERVAGDAQDLFSVPGGHTMNASAPYYWKYGIYKPAREALMPTSKQLLRAMDKLPSYDDIIAQRVAYWRGLGDRAPFWILIDQGTAAFGDEDRAYPQFPGTHFVDQFRMIAHRVVERAKFVYIENVVSSLGAEIEEFIREPKKGGRVKIASIPVSEKEAVSVLYSSAGNVFFQIGRRSLSFQEAKALVKRSYR